MDLQSIQTKLIHTVNALGQTDADVQVDWPGGPPLAGSSSRPTPKARRGADFSTAVNTLQQRAEPFHFSPPDAAIAPEVYVKRLNAMVHKINQFSIEQERAIAEIQKIQARLAQGYPAVDSRGQPVVPPYLDSQRAVIASAEADDRGNIVLAYRTVTPSSPLPGTTQAGPAYGEANQLASHLRTTYGPPASQGWKSVAADVMALGQEPSQLVARLGSTLWGFVLGWTRSAASYRPKSETIPGSFGQGSSSFDKLNGEISLSWVDAMLWFGSGVISRLALNLLIGSFPALWSLAVAAITAVTAYALYRATLAPKVAFGPAIRVALLVVGLVVGGQI